MDKEQIIYKIKHLPYLLKLLLTNGRGSGLKKTTKDQRDFNTEKLGWNPFGYSPKYAEKINKTLTIKDQKTFNTCVFNGTSAMHEPNEGMPLSVRFMVAMAKKLGLITGTGVTDIRTGFKMLKEYGTCEESLLPENNNGDFESYTNVDTERFKKNADSHKIASFWSVTSRSDILKLIDEGKILGTGMDWYSGFNQGGGFSLPWLIMKIIGWLIGGHFIIIKGYKMSYQGRKVYVCQNSYSKLWGDNGDFYVDMDYLEKNDYGIYTILDVPLDIAKFLNDYDGKNVKGFGPTIYFIQKGVKKAYTDEVTFLAFNVQDKEIKSYSLVKDDILSKVANGDNMDITKSLYWDLLKDIQGNEEREKVLIEHIHQNK